ncbi:MAG TPA: ABC transporter permease [Phycisphaerales bacterium]|nr:ABC transporter permease [Phycisphaerales bacterium]
MIAPRFLPLILKQVSRHTTRTLLTVAGVTVAMFLFIAVQTLQHSVRKATETTAADTTLVVYRENRFCPATSRIPEYYGPRIEKIAGVKDVIPMAIVVNNCRASLDVITFRGVPQDDLSKISGDWKLVEGDLADWNRRSDAAFVGERLAQRRGFKVGQSFDSSGITVYVAGIIRSPHPQDENVAYVHLDFIQRASTSRAGQGIVTQFTVHVNNPAELEQIAEKIDAEFRHEADPTTTRSEKAFVAQAGADLVEIVRFTRYLGWGCLAAVLALVANAIVLSVQDRIKEHAVLQTLGFRSGVIARLIVGEGLVMGIAGGVLGTALAVAVVRYGNFSLSNEGQSVNITSDWNVVALGLALAAGVGVVAGLVPAWQASRREIAACFRAV